MTSLLMVTSQSLKEAMRSKVLYNVIFLSIALVGVTYVATEFSYGNASRVSLDIGLGFMSLSLGVIAILMGSSLIIDEIDSRTLYMVLSRPVSRSTFLVGKFCGLAIMLFINVLLLYVVVLALFLKFNGGITTQHFWVFLFIYFESLIILSAALFFSSFTNKVITILMTLTLWSCGHGIDLLRDFSIVKLRPALLKFVELYSALMPNFNKINMKLYVLNNDFYQQGNMLYLVLYSILWIIIFLTFTKIIFDNKELS